MLELFLEMSNPIVLYDGVCGLCNRLVQFILHRDQKAVFRFAALQSAFAARVLARHGASPTDLDTFYVVLNYNDAHETLISRSDAAVYVLKQLGGIWRIVAIVGRVLPQFLRDGAYSRVARNRYRIFGRYDACPLPSEDTRSRFVDQ
jgi:predicted DCC family thiol-disulfide oxidoreductase YuxK